MIARVGLLWRAELRGLCAVIFILANLDNVTYVAALCELFRRLGSQITMEDISALWKCQETQNNSGIYNILKLLSEVGANGFNQAQLEHVLQLVKDVSRNSQRYIV